MDDEDWDKVPGWGPEVLELVDVNWDDGMTERLQLIQVYTLILVLDPAAKRIRREIERFVTIYSLAHAD